MLLQLCARCVSLHALRLLQRRQRPELNPLVGTAYTLPVVSASYAASTFVDSFAAPSASKFSASTRSVSPAVNRATPGVHGTLPVNTAPLSATASDAPKLPLSLQLFWAKNPDACPVRSALEFRATAAPIERIEAGLSHTLPPGLSESLGRSGTLASTAVARVAKSDAGSLEKTLMDVQCRPVGHNAPVVVPPLIQAALESHLVAAGAVPGALPTLFPAAVPGLAVMRAAQRFHQAAARVQGGFRMWHARLRFQKLKLAALLLQRWSRMHLAKFLLLKIRQAKRDMAEESVLFCVQMCVLLPIGRSWFAFRRTRRLNTIIAKWHHWAHVTRRANAACAQHLRTFKQLYFGEFAATALEDARMRKGLARIEVGRRARIKRTVLKLLLRHAEIRVFVRWKRKRIIKKRKWIAFRALVDAVHTSQRMVVRIQRRYKVHRLRRRLQARILINVVLRRWIMRYRRREMEAEARERCGCIASARAWAVV